MRYTGDDLFLHYCTRRKQRAGPDEQHPPYFFFAKLLPEIRRHNAGGASAARAARVHLLAFCVVDEHTAVAKRAFYADPGGSAAVLSRYGVDYIVVGGSERYDDAVDEYGLMYQKSEYSDQHLYYIDSRIFAENQKEQLETERGNFLVFQGFNSKTPKKDSFILIFNVLAEELGKYYLDCWGGTFDNCETNSEGQNWIDVLTENELRKMVANTIHSVKMVENENELKKIESDFG